MRKPISTQMHGFIDFVMAGTLAALPKLLGFNRPTACAMQAMAGAKLATALMTDNETGLVRKIPMPVHLAVDVVSGAGLAAMPFMMDEDDETARATCVALGAMEIMAALMTQTTPTQRSLPRQAVRGTRDLAQQAVRRGREAVGV